MPAVRTYSLWEFRHAQGSACISLAHTAFRANNDDEDFAMSVILWERRSILALNYLLLVVLGCLASVSNQCVENSECKNGYCRAGMCICNPGWWGSLCQFCRLRWENRLFRSSSLTQLRHVNYVLLWNRSLPDIIVIIHLNVVVVDPFRLAQSCVGYFLLF